LAELEPLAFGENLRICHQLCSKCSSIAKITLKLLDDVAIGQLVGATENAGVENAIRAKLQGWKMQEWKMRE